MKEQSTKWRWLPVLLVFFALKLNSTGQPLAIATVQFIHNSPDSLLDTVDVVIDIPGGQHVCKKLPFLWVTNRMSIYNPGPLSIQIALPGGTSIYSQSFQVDSGDVKIAVLNGVSDSSIYPNVDPLHIDVFDPADTVGLVSQNRILVHHGSPDAPDLNFTTTLSTPQVLGTNLPFEDFGSNYISIADTDSIIKVYDATLLNLNRTYMFPSKYWGEFPDAGLIFSSGFVDPSYTMTDPEFHLYYAGDSAGYARPLIELRNDAPIWIQELYSTRVWFGEIDTFSCSNHSYQWEFFDSNQVSIGTASGCDLVFPFPDVGAYSARVIVGTDTFGFGMMVRCPEYKIQFEVTQVSPDTLCVINNSIAGPNWLPSWIPTVWEWIIGGDTIYGPNPCVATPTDTCDLIDLQVTATNGCGSNSTERMLIMAGYVPDKPLRSQHWTCSPGHTPITWAIPDNWGNRDMNPMDKIDDHLTYPYPGGLTDILVYYTVPEGCYHPDIKKAFRDFVPGSITAVGTFDRISKYLTVASYRGVNQEFVNLLLSQPACTCSTLVPLPISLITSDVPVPGNHHIATSRPKPLTGSEIRKVLGLDNNPFGLGDGVGIGVIGAGIQKHDAFSHLPNHVCAANPPIVDHNYMNYVSFVDGEFTNCNFNSTFEDIEGAGTAKTSLLAANVKPPNQGICPFSNFFFLDVASPQTVSRNIQNLIRKSDVLEAFDWAIYNKSSSVPMSILICDFSFDEKVDSNDAISVMANIASSYGLAVFTSVGTADNWLGPPGNASQTVTIAGAYSDNAGKMEPLGNGIQGIGYGSPNNDPIYFKPDLIGAVNGVGAGPSQAAFGKSLYNLEFPSYIEAGLTSLVLTIRPDFNLQKLKLALAASAKGNQLNLPDIVKGHGPVNGDSLIRILRQRNCDLGFSDWFGKDDCISHQSENIVTGLPNDTDDSHPLVQKDEVLHIKVRITNYGHRYDPAQNPGTVSLFLHCFSNQTLHPFDLAYIERPLKTVINENEEVEIEFIFKAPVAMDVFCTEASINCICDCNPHNDIAKRNDYRICVDQNSPFFIGKRKVFGPYDSDSIFEKIVETPPNSGYLFLSGFKSGVFTGDEFPLHANDTIVWNPFATQHVQGATFCVTSYVVFGNDTLYNGGVTYTVCDTSAPISSPAPQPPTPSIQIYPVPATQSVTLRVDPASTGPGSIELYTLLGQMIERREMQWQKGATKEEVFRLDDLPGGVYLFKISIRGRATFKKFVKI